MPKVLANPIFINNSTDDTGRIVSNVYAKKMSKQGKIIWYMVWQYYRHRSKLDVKAVIKEEKLRGHEVKINYSDIKITKDCSDSGTTYSSDQLIQEYKNTSDNDYSEKYSESSE